MSWVRIDSSELAALDDEQFLDRALEAAVDATARGAGPELDEFQALRPHLVRELEEVLATARGVALGSVAQRPRFLDYELVRELGRGGMGTVYLARQLRLGGRLVALKTLPPGALLSLTARERFVREVRALARVDHAGVVRVHDVLRDSDQLAYAMDWIDGPTLADLVAVRVQEGARFMLAGALPQLPDERRATSYPRFIARIGLELARALACVHAQRLLHRDIKPSNVLLRASGEAVLSDFGLVQPEEATRFTETGAFLGTPAFASPEQLHGRPLDERSDVYSLGATLYFALSGRAPFLGRNATEVLRAMESSAPARLRKLDPRTPRDLETVANKALAIDPEQRYATADELAEDLRRWLDDEPIRARAPGLLRRGWVFARRHRQVLTSGIGGGLIVAAATALLSVAFWWAPREIANEVRRARLQLLNPAHSELLWMRFQVGEAHAITPKFRERLGAALERCRAATEHYGRAQRLSIGRGVGELAVERDAVQAAERRLQGFEPDLDRARFPATRDWLEAWEQNASKAPDLTARLAHASQEDRRAAGLIAFLCGEIDAIREAWEPLDPMASDDPLLDAALGQMYLRMGRPDWATHRLRSAVNHFDDVGFLMTDFARATFENGELELARTLIERSRRLPLAEPFSALETLDARLLVLEGKTEEALTIFLALVSLRADPAIREALIRLLVSRSEIARAHYYSQGLSFGRFSTERRRELHKRLFERMLCEQGARIVMNCSHGAWFPTSDAPHPLARYLYDVFRKPAWNAQTRARRREMTLERLLAEID
jgi:hypothetical protein